MPWRGSYAAYHERHGAVSACELWDQDAAQDAADRRAHRLAKLGNPADPPASALALQRRRQRGASGDARQRRAHLVPNRAPRTTLGRPWRTRRERRAARLANALPTLAPDDRALLALPTSRLDATDLGPPSACPLLGAKPLARLIAHLRTSFDDD
jgi:hypothetical protein